MDHTWVNVAQVIVDERRKRDPGDLGPLIKSIEQHGLLNPIVLTKNNRLISGWRRLQAFKKLGRKSIDAYFVDNIFDAVELIDKEGESPLYFKEMTWSERVAFALILEEMDEERVRFTKINARLKAAEVRYSGKYGAIYKDREPSTRAMIAHVLGCTVSLYGAARFVYIAAHDPEASDKIKELCQRAVKRMDETGQPNAGKVVISKGMEAALRVEQPDIVGTAADQRKVLDGAGPVMSALVHGFREITAVHPDLTRDESLLWLDNLSRARREIEQMIKKLRRHIADG